MAKLAVPLVRLELVGPTAEDDVRRLIWRYGVQAIKTAVKNQTTRKGNKPKSGDTNVLVDICREDAANILAGMDPFKIRSDYSLAKKYADNCREPMTTKGSVWHRINRKLKKERRMRAYFAASVHSRDSRPHQAHLHILACAIQHADKTLKPSLEQDAARAQAAIQLFLERCGRNPDESMTLKAIEDSNRKPLPPPPAPVRMGLFGNVFSKD